MTHQVRKEEEAPEAAQTVHPCKQESRVNQPSVIHQSSSDHKDVLTGRKPVIASTFSSQRPVSPPVPGLKQRSWTDRLTIPPHFKTSTPHDTGLTRD